MHEQHLLDHVARVAGEERGVVLLGPGDDMAMVRWDGERLLASVDQVVDGVHVRLKTTDVALIGRKAMARSLSDIAAMAAEPVAALATALLPVSMTTATAKTLFDAMHQMAAAHGAPLIGGDIAAHRSATGPLTLTVTVLARPSGDRVVTRRGLVAGDGLYVTGALGGGFDEATGQGRHLTFAPRLAAGRALLAALGDDLHAMIDLSDGAGRDAARLDGEDDLQLRIDAPSLPVHDDLDWRRAASDGEDYELLFAATGTVPGDLPGEAHDILDGEAATTGPRCPVTRIGQVVPRPAGDQRRVVFIDGEHEYDGAEFGWEHTT